MRKAAKTKTKDTDLGKPGLTPEEEENQCIALAYSRAKQRLLDGTATSQEITHFLKRGSSLAKVEKEILMAQKELYTAKTESIRSTKRNEEALEEVKRALQRYQGYDEEYEDDEELYGTHSIEHI